MKDEIIKELELSLIEYTDGLLEDRLKQLPLLKPSQIKAMIYNLFKSGKWKGKLSLSIYSQIMDEFFSRLTAQKQKEAFEAGASIINIATDDSYERYQYHLNQKNDEKEN